MPALPLPDRQRPICDAFNRDTVTCTQFSVTAEQHQLFTFSHRKRPGLIQPPVAVHVPDLYQLASAFLIRQRQCTTAGRHPVNGVTLRRPALCIIPFQYLSFPVAVRQSAVFTVEEHRRQRGYRYLPVAQLSGRFQ